MAEIAVRAMIEGRVQGVGFRAWTAHEAARRNLRGWVRNRGDGSVEALFIGEADAVESMLEACRRGPRLAHVLAVKREPARDDGSRGFTEHATV